jgi:prophage tail gpP-like protein
MNPDEIAELTVADHKFSNWKSVWVQHRWAEAYPIFKFTSADIAEVPSDWALLQFKPGDECAIYLGKKLAAAGIITVRQTAYNKTSKGVQFEGVGVTWYAARSSIINATGNFDDKPFEAIADEVLKPTGIKMLPVGILNAIPFARCQCEKGEKIWDFLERLARVRGIVLGSDHLGNMLGIDTHTKPIVATLQEGFNIIEMQAIISIQDIYSDYILEGQTAASDLQNMQAASEQQADVAGTAKRYSPVLTPAEQPVWSIAELLDRAKNEYIWHEGTLIQVTVVVQGWMRPGTHELWRAGDNVSVYSPMAMIIMTLKIRTITFTQDRQSGTRTALDLVAPWLLKDTSPIDLRQDTQQPTVPNTPAPPQTQPNVPPPETLEE